MPSDPAPIEEPAAIPRIRSQAFASGHIGPGGPALLCPRCGHGTLAFLRILTFNRQADERSMHFIRVEDDVTTRHHIVAERGVPLERYRGTTIEFGCFSCISVYDDMLPVEPEIGHGIWLEIEEHRGAVCVMHWSYDPLPEDYHAHEAA
jgi:hypothetical protein